MASRNLSDLDKYYSAYREYTEALAKVRTYGNLKSTLADANNGEDGFSGAVTHRDIDLSWVEPIEKAIPYIDRAIREERRYILQTEEVVPIEKSKQITTESVRHLAQHTNMIGRVENDEVTPKEILNIFREENYAIYENRFLRCAIRRAYEFVNKCIEAVSGVNDDIVASVNMERNVFVDKQAFNVSLNCDLQYHEENREVSVTEDVSTLTGFERVLRLRKILSDFLSAPLIKALAESAEVRSPITRTNLLTKDPAFREVLVLWEFFDEYERSGQVGYKLIIEPTHGEMTPNMQTGLYDAISLLQFVIKLNIGSELKETLAQRYKLEQERIEAERIRLEEERKHEEEKRLAKALEEQQAQFRIQLDEIEKNHQSEIEKLTEDWERRVEELKAEALRILEETKADYEQKLESQKAGYEQKLAEQKDAYEDQLAKQKSGYEQKLADQQEAYEGRISTIQSEHNAEIADMISKHADEISKVTDGYEQKIRMADEAHTEEVNGIRQTCEDEKQAVIREYEETVAGVRAECAGALEAEKERSRQTLDDLSKKQDAEIRKAVDAAVSPLQSEIDKRKAEHTRICEKMNAINGSLQKIESENSQLQSENKKLTKKLATSDKTHASEMKAKNKTIDDLRHKVDHANEKYQKKVQKVADRYEKEIRELKKSIEPEIK